ncbi:MAG: hypothetical protein OXE86_02780 [Alphaproteobacteria bacterium]|nr:hypothetical protein [Alphaproteobacteria bacterium]
MDASPGRGALYLRSTRAVSALEYALVGIVATVIAGALVAFGGYFGPAFTTVGHEVTESASEAVD